jgi:hypothetical protein
MPHKANGVIFEKILNQEWFQPYQGPEVLPSDNWRFVKDAEDSKALLYIVRFASKTGEPRGIPNEPTALQRLADLNRRYSLSSGPFIALAEVSDATASPDVISIRVWNIRSKLRPDRVRIPLEELCDPLFKC